jgi:hypothetical protein
MYYVLSIPLKQGQCSRIIISRDYVGFFFLTAHCCVLCARASASTQPALPAPGPRHRSNTTLSISSRAPAPRGTWYVGLVSLQSKLVQKCETHIDATFGAPNNISTYVATFGGWWRRLPHFSTHFWICGPHVVQIFHISTPRPFFAHVFGTSDPILCINIRSTHMFLPTLPEQTPPATYEIHRHHMWGSASTFLY